MRLLITFAVAAAAFAVSAPGHAQRVVASFDATSNGYSRDEACDRAGANARRNGAQRVYACRCRTDPQYSDMVECTRHAEILGVAQSMPMTNPYSNGAVVVPGVR
jgi:hypothetical protein